MRQHGHESATNTFLPMECQLIIACCFDNVDDMLRNRVVCKDWKNRVDDFSFNTICSILTLFTGFKHISITKDNDGQLPTLFDFKINNFVEHAQDIRGNILEAGEGVQDHQLDSFTGFVDYRGILIKQSPNPASIAGEEDCSISIKLFKSVLPDSQSISGWIVNWQYFSEVFVNGHGALHYSKCGTFPNEKEQKQKIVELQTTSCGSSFLLSSFGYAKFVMWMVNDVLPFLIWEAKNPAKQWVIICKEDQLVGFFSWVDTKEVLEEKLDLLDLIVVPAPSNDSTLVILKSGVQSQ